MSGGAIDFAAELLIHGILAALVVEALLHWLPVTTPAARFPYRLTVLLAPLVFAPLFAWAAPFRRTDWFQDLSAFVSGRWALLAIGSIDARFAFVVLGLVIGTLLLARDIGHATFDLWQIRRREAHLRHTAVPARLTRLLSGVAAEMNLRPPAIDLLASDTHALHCRGWRRPRVVISSGTLDALDDEELRSALAHELAHIRHHDVVRGWLLLFLRALQPFNPIAQAVGRMAAHELEWRADDRAAGTTDRPLALARALVRCARRRGDQFLGLSGAGRFRTLEQRCRRLMAGAAPPDARWTGEVLVLWLGLGLVFFVVQ